MRKRICLLLLIAAILITGCSQLVQNKSQYDSLKEFLLNGEMYFGTSLNDDDSVQDLHIQKEAAVYLLKGSFDKQVDRTWVGENFYFGESRGWPMISVSYAEMPEPTEEWSAVKGWGFVFTSKAKQEELGYKSDRSILVLATYSEYEVKAGILPSLHIREEYNEYWLYLLPADAHDQLTALMESCG